MRRRRPAKTGFTLLEVILAIVLTLGLIGSALSFNHYVQTVKGQVLTDVEAVVAQQRTMEMLTTELRSAFVPALGQSESDSSPAFAGSSGQVDFLSTLMPGPSACLPPEQHTAEMPPQSDVQRVIYRIRYSQMEDGTTHNDGLERVSLSWLPGVDEDSSPAMADLVAPGVHFLRLRYHVGDPANSGYSGPIDNGWVDDWQGGLPLAVEITMGPNPIADGQDINDYLAANETFRRVVYLPGTRIAALGGAQ